MCMADTENKYMNENQTQTTSNFFAIMPKDFLLKGENCKKKIRSSHVKHLSEYNKTSLKRHVIFTYSLRL